MPANIGTIEGLRETLKVFLEIIMIDSIIINEGTHLIWIPLDALLME